MLEKVKKSLRVSSTAFDDEITALIKSAELELKRVGVHYVEADDLIKQAIIQFCKARFGYDNKEADRFEQNFNKMCSALSLCGDYNALE